MMYNVLMADLSPKVENPLPGAGTTCQKHQGATIALLAPDVDSFLLAEGSSATSASHPPIPILCQNQG